MAATVDDIATALSFAIRDGIRFRYEQDALLRVARDLGPGYEATVRASWKAARCYDCCQIVIPTTCVSASGLCFTCTGGGVAAVREVWGRKIRLQRKAMQMSQRQLAEAVGVDQSAVSFWENGTRAPSLDHQVAVARALRCHPQVLFAFEIDQVA